MSKTTLDLSTLSDIADGTHTVKVKAKADGYYDSEFSNEVSYTKAPTTYWGTIKNVGDAKFKMSVTGLDSNENLAGFIGSGESSYDVEGYPKYKVMISNHSWHFTTEGSGYTYSYNSDNAGQNWTVSPNTNNFNFVLRTI